MEGPTNPPLPLIPSTARIGKAESSLVENVSAYERATREPSLLVLLLYARFAGVSMEILVDDKMSLPEKLPAISKT